MTAAVVLGGGFAGVLAAAVLARHADEVVVVEGDRYPSGPSPRRGLPQAHHSHVLVTGGARALEELLPGTLPTLYARGAHRRGLTGDALILSAEGWFGRHDTGAYLVSCTRALLDQVIRGRALAGGRVTVWQRTRALGLTGDAARVTGVTISRAGGPPETVEADLVVDATGRRSQAPAWLAGLGVPEVPEAVVASGLAYATRIYRAPAGLAAGMPAIMIHPGATDGRPGRGATLFPIEDERWVVTLTGTRGGEPPAREPGFAAFARGLRSPIVAVLTAAATPLGGIRPYRDTANRRRFFERTPLPEGFLAIGDAVVAVNPVYSHGMSIAALGALRLDRELTRHGGVKPARTPELQSALAEVADPSWRMAVAQDGRYAPEDAPPGEPAAVPRRARSLLSRAALTSPALATRLFHAQTLITPAAITPAAITPAAITSAAGQDPTP
ncbi:NAD(P)/FAD-dependent oxidoreductase [Nonomuraea candida]|uniref:NAD(P)/FAD-dependent oxidoreductase n=1 Tax=Nonomuraea candida TaxID=359159 RepID=UPI000694F2FA|nr:FAD-dependent oxidoreductase [Nonomuraea candida]